MTMQGVELAVRCDECGGVAVRGLGQFTQERERGRKLWWDSEVCCPHCGAYCCEHSGPGPVPEAVREALLTVHGPSRLRPVGTGGDAVAALRVFRKDLGVSLGRARELLAEFREFGLVGTAVEMAVLHLRLRDHGVLTEVSAGTGRAYRYVGPPELWSGGVPGGLPLRTEAQFATWAGERTAAELAEPFTFVVDLAGFLRLAPRRSEHVACAGGGLVLGAGEVRFGQDDGDSGGGGDGGGGGGDSSGGGGHGGGGGGGGGWVAEEVSNQSTGYCPDVASWPAVAAALDRIGVRRPEGFTYEVVFRRCPACRCNNIVREGHFVCVFCDGDLPVQWNVDDSSPA